MVTPRELPKNPQSQLNGIAVSDYLRSGKLVPVTAGKLTAKPQILCSSVLAMRSGLSSCRPLALICWDVMLEK